MRQRHPQFVERIRESALFLVCLFLSSYPSYREETPGQIVKGEIRFSLAPEIKSRAKAEPVLEVLMINGGGNRSINYRSHLLHLKEMKKLLLDSGVQAEKITIMSADGSDPAADLAVREGQTESDAWMLDGSDLDKFLRPRTEFEDSKIEGVTLLQATREQLHRWFEQAGHRLHPQDTLLLYVTDHGTKDRITLWGKDEYLDVAELRRMFTLLEPGVRIVQLMSQCYSGSFAGLMYRKEEDTLPSGNVCGFFSSTAERPAYGCYPETRNKEDIGHSFRFIEAVAAGNDFRSAHSLVLASDDTPDVPLKTSDVFLESLLQEYSLRNGRSLNDTIDELLREAWLDAAKWEPEIRLLDRISESFGYFSPRLIRELDRNSGELDKVSRAFDYYSNKWKAAYHALNRETLQRFLADNPSWASNSSKEALASLDPEAQSRFARNLLSALRTYTPQDAEAIKRMQLLKHRSEETASALYRMEVRQGVVLRLRALLTSIAGRIYIEKHGTAEQRKSYQALSGCESFALATPRKHPPAGVTKRPFPSYDEELELGKTLLPGWMGIRYEPIADEVRNKFGLGSGAVTVSSIFPASPALDAGLQQGDIIIGTPGEFFVGHDRVREWVMMAPIGIPQVLSVQRGLQRFEVSITPLVEPGRWTDAPTALKVGSAAPSLDKLRLYRGNPPPQRNSGASYLLFFFATWCAPCKASLPELGAFERQQNIPVIAITNEPSKTLDAFFEKQKGDFPGTVMTDEFREAFIAYGVNATPTFVLVERGAIKSIKTGYRADQGLGLR